MQSFAIFFTTLMATFVAGQGVTSAVAPEASAPASCVGSYDGSFEITVAKVEGAVKRDVNTIAVSQLLDDHPPARFTCFSSLSFVICPRGEGSIASHIPPSSTTPRAVRALPQSPQPCSPTPVCFADTPPLFPKATAMLLGCFEDESNEPVCCFALAFLTVSRRSW